MFDRNTTNFVNENPNDRIALRTGNLRTNKFESTLCCDQLRYFSNTLIDETKIHRFIKQNKKWAQDPLYALRIASSCYITAKSFAIANKSAHIVTQPLDHLTDLGNTLFDLVKFLFTWRTCKLFAHHSYLFRTGNKRVAIFLDCLRTVRNTFGRFFGFCNAPVCYLNMMFPVRVGYPAFLDHVAGNLLDAWEKAFLFE